MIKIKYLFHSGFTIETETDYLVFDYFKDNCSKQMLKDCGQLEKDSFPKDKKVTFFVTHSHYDHFDKEIFHLVNNAHYIVSDDIKINEAPNIKICGPYEKFEFNGISVHTYGSTDAGLSFLVQLDDKKIFHAGDLNWWHWEGETEDERAFAKRVFFAELEKIKGEVIDIAFFPVDPRLETAYYYGGKEFIEKIKPKYFIPMHFQDSFTITTKFKKLMDDTNTDTIVFSLNKRGEIIEL